MRSSLSAVTKAILGCAAVVACAAVSAAEPAHPDFTGLWTGHREPGQGRASGFGGPQAGLPLTEDGKKRIEDYNKLLGPERANPAAYCVDYGVPTVMELPGGYPIEFIQKPNQLTIIYEVENETRRIYIGDRQLPPQKRLPSRDGYSEGHWEGDTLVVKTTDLLDGQDQGGQEIKIDAREQGRAGACEYHAQVHRIARKPIRSLSHESRRWAEWTHSYSLFAE